MPKVKKRQSESKLEKSSNVLIYSATDLLLLFTLNCAPYAIRRPNLQAIAQHIALNSEMVVLPEWDKKHWKSFEHWVISVSEAMGRCYRAGADKTLKAKQSATDDECVLCDDAVWLALLSLAVVIITSVKWRVGVVGIAVCSDSRWWAGGQRWGTEVKFKGGRLSPVTAVEVLSWPGPNKTLPSPERVIYEQVIVRFVSDELRSYLLCSSVEEGNWQPISDSVILSGLDSCHNLFPVGPGKETPFY